MWKILVATERSLKKGAIYCTTTGSGDIQEKRKVEKKGGCVFFVIDCIYDNPHFLFFSTLDWIPIDEKHYLFVDSKLSFEDAANHCKTLGGKLFEPRNPATYEKVYEIAKKLGTLGWIGIEDLKTEGKFVYHSTQEALSFSQWSSGNPNNHANYGGENCAELYWHRGAKGGQWMNDGNCDNEYKSICEK